MTIPIPDQPTVLSSWKDIAAYTGKGVRTVQRWDRDFGLPVRRPVGSSTKSAVLLYRSDLDAWLAQRALQSRLKSQTASARKRSGPRSSGLAETIRTAKELRATRHALADQIEQSVRLLTQRCEALIIREP
jgi:hypothetical protein